MTSAFLLMLTLIFRSGSSKCWLRRDLSARTSSLSPLSALHVKKLRKCSAPCWLIQNVLNRVLLFKVHVARRVSTQISWLFFCFSHWARSCDGREPAACLLMNQMWPVWMKCLIPSCANVFAPVGGLVEIHHLALWAVISHSRFTYRLFSQQGLKKKELKK